MVTTYLKALLGHKKLSKSTAWSQNVLGPWRVNVGMSNKTNGTTLLCDELRSISSIENQSGDETRDTCTLLDAYFLHVLCSIEGYVLFEHAKYSNPSMIPHKLPEK